MKLGTELLPEFQNIGDRFLYCTVECSDFDFEKMEKDNADMDGKCKSNFPFFKPFCADLSSK